MRGNEAADEKDDAHGKARRYDGKHEIRNAFCGASADDAHEDAREKEDQKHRYHVFITDALPHNFKLFIKGQAFVLQAGNQKRDQKYDDDGNDIKAHLNFHCVFKYDTERKVQHDEYADRQKRPCLFLIHLILP